MQNEIFLFARVVFSILFFFLLFAGGYMFKNYQKLFGVDPNMPSEGPSSRAYSKVQVFSIWAHATALTGAFALFLH
jgi:hypothetical protein